MNSPYCTFSRNILVCVCFCLNKHSHPLTAQCTITKKVILAEIRADEYKRQLATPPDPVVSALKRNAAPLDSPSSGFRLNCPSESGMQGILWWWTWLFRDTTTPLFYEGGPFIWQRRDSMDIVHSPLPLNDDPWRVSAIKNLPKLLWFHMQVFIVQMCFAMHFIFFIQEETPFWVNTCNGTYLFSEDCKSWLYLEKHYFFLSGWTMDSN